MRNLVDTVIDGLAVMVTTGAPFLIVFGIYKLVGLFA